jgi:hypothetical protein
VGQGGAEVKHISIAYLAGDKFIIGKGELTDADSQIVLNKEEFDELCEFMAKRHDFAESYKKPIQNFRASK